MDKWDERFRLSNGFMEEVVDAAKDATNMSSVLAKVPTDATVFYLNLFDDRKCAVSTAHTENQ